VIALLIRHAPHGRVHDQLCGRLPGISLDAEGRAAAERLARRCRALVTLDAIYVSPIERALETAQILGCEAGLLPVTDTRLTELDCGTWTGRSFRELATDPAWRTWNERRASARTPAGEGMADLLSRMGACLADVGRRHPLGTVAFVSHAEPIRAVLLATDGRSADDWASIDVPTASIHALRVDASGRIERIQRETAA